MNNELALSISGLDGYVRGVVAVDGEIRQYTADVFLVSGTGHADNSPENAIRNFYVAQTDIQFLSSQRLEHGLRDLERLLGHYLIRRPWGLAEETIAPHSLDDRRRFLAFRIMDMIGEMAHEARNLSEVYKLETGGSDTRPQSTFFCIRINAGLLVLQFNDDSLRIRTAHSH